MTIARQTFLSSLILTYMFIAAVPCSAQLFGGQEEKKESHKTVGGTPQMREDSDVKQTGFAGIPMPKLTMPKLTMPDMSSVTAPFKSGYNKVSAGTKSAWEGTKEMFSFGGGSNAQQANNSQPKPGLWERLTAPDPPKNDGPQTVGEWMSQPRLDP